MSDQYFNERVDRVAGRDYIEQHIHSHESRLLLGPQKWVAKYYGLGTSITAGWLTFFLLLGFTMFTVFAASQSLSAIHLFVVHKAPPSGLLLCLLMVIAAAIVPILMAAVQVSSHGFLGISGTQIGIVRDVHRRVFVGQLGGEGSFCPLCGEKLHFHTLGPSPILGCTRNKDHRWAFDFTAVRD